MRRWLYSSIGAACCAALAASLVPIFDETWVEPFLPVLFLAAILAVAIRFGHFAGMAGTLAAALIFTLFLFEPKWSLVISNHSSRHYLIAMLILGIVLSDLFGAYSIVGPRSRSRL